MELALVSFLVFVWFGSIETVLTRAESNQNNVMNKSEILRAIFETYDKTDHASNPLLNGKQETPLFVDVGLNVHNVDELDDIKQQLSLEVLFTHQWEDRRLKFDHIKRESKIQDHIVLPTDEKYHVWSPDTFFSNEISGSIHTLIVPNTETLIFANGTVYQSFRLSLTLSCEMNLRSFPLDTQTCPVKIETYSWSVQDVILRWRESEVKSVKPGFSSAKFSVRSIYKRMCQSTSVADDYSCLSLYIEFERELGFYFLHIYVPCMLLIVISFVPFWIQPSAIETRLSLAVTNILAMITQVYGISQSSPTTSYIKSIDVWSSFCIFMGFTSLLKIATSNYFFQERNKNLESSGAGEEPETENATKWMSLRLARNIDTAAKIFFPLVFLFFNLVYWSVY